MPASCTSQPSSRPADAASGLAARVPKQLLAVGGRAILERSVAAFLAHPAVDEVVVALPPSSPTIRRRICAAPASRCGSSPAARGGRIRSRTRSRAVDAASDVIVIHDAARPFASADLIARTIAAAAESGAAVAALPARDTVKRGRSGGDAG